MTTTGIVLAGGRSSRFGGSKLEAKLAGRTVLDRAIDAVAATCDEVVVVGPAAGGRADVRYLPDAAPFAGPLTGLVVGLEAARGDVSLLVGGDMPLARSGVLGLLLARLEGPATAALLEEDGEKRPLPMAIRRDDALAAAISAIEAGERSLRAFLGRLDAAVVPASAWRDLDPDGDTLLDVDTPADLERARARLGTGG